MKVEMKSAKVFGEVPIKVSGEPRPTGEYIVGRCPNCSELHLSIRAPVVLIQGHPPAMQLNLSKAEAHALAEALISHFEVH